MPTPSTVSSAPPEPLANVQALRGVAALLVLTMHAIGRQMKHFGAGGAAMLEADRVARSVGHFGVDIFFVISGFIIYTIAERASPPNASGTHLRPAARFIWRRVLRIYPLFWITAGAMVVVDVPASAFRVPPFPAPLLPQLLLATRYVEIHTVAWTLAFEMYFYCVVAACVLAFGARATIGIALWIAAEAMLIVAWNNSPAVNAAMATWHDAIMLDPMVLEFGLGCAVAALVGRRPRLSALALTGAAIVPIAIGIWQLYGRFATRSLAADPYLRLQYFGTGATLLLTGVVLLERRDHLVAPRWLQALGDASYSLYLWHVPVIVALGEAGRRTPFLWAKGGAIMALLEALAALLVAFVSYRCIERPLLDRARASARAQTDQARAA